eukprot:6201514-Pleurochrysis_carterae.AAC.4
MPLPNNLKDYCAQASLMAVRLALVASLPRVLVLDGDFVTAAERRRGHDFVTHDGEVALSRAQMQLVRACVQHSPARFCSIFLMMSLVSRAWSRRSAGQRLSCDATPDSQEMLGCSAAIAAS